MIYDLRYTIYECPVMSKGHSRRRRGSGRRESALIFEGRTTGVESERTHVGCYAFSLIEIMVTIGLLSLIVLGLLAMFSQTQQAFLSSRTQTDVLSAGRAIADMVGREIEQTKPANTFSINFYAGISTNFQKPLYQGLPGSNYRRTNIVEDLYFLSQSNQDWIATGYRVLSRDNPAAFSAGLVGTLYRYSYSQRKADAYNLSFDFTNQPRANLRVIADGIVHFRIRAFDTNGFLMNPLWANNFKRQLSVNTTAALKPIDNEVNYSFWSNAVPAYIELELGILEPRTLERYRSLPDTSGQAQRLYLSNHVAQVQLFRQRIPIRNVDFSAYQ